MRGSAHSSCQSSGKPTGELACPRIRIVHRQLARDRTGGSYLFWDLSASPASAPYSAGAHPRKRGLGHDSPTTDMPRTQGKGMSALSPDMPPGATVFGMDPSRGGRGNLGGPEVGQVVLPATPGGSPATGEWQVNVPLTRNNDLPYGFLVPADSVTDPSRGHLPGGVALFCRAEVEWTSCTWSWGVLENRGGDAQWRRNVSTSRTRSRKTAS